MRRFVVMMLVGMMFFAFIHMPTSGLFAQSGVSAFSSISKKKVRPARHMVLPGAIVANAGQWKPDVLYGDMLGRYAFTREGVRLSRERKRESEPLATLGATDLALLENAPPEFHRFVNPSPRMEVRAGAMETGVGNVYAGSDTMHWRSGMPMFAGVLYRNVWDSIDAEFTQDGGRLGLTFRLRPGARQDDVRMASSNGDIITPFDPPAGNGTRSGFTQTSPGGRTVAASGGYADSMAYDTEFSTYFSIRNEHWISSFKIHTDGSMFISGLTHPKHYGLDSQDFVQYVIHLSCDGRNMLYTTLYYPTRDEKPNIGWLQESAPLCVRRDGHAVAAGFATRNNMRLPLTPDALEYVPTVLPLPTSFIFELDEAGRLLYASLFGNKPNEPSVATISSIVLDSKENLLVHGSYYGATFRYLTSGTVSYGNSNLYGSYLVNLPSALDSVQWGTRVGCYNHGEDDDDGEGGLVLDSLENIILLGEVYVDLDSIPLVNAAYPDPPQHDGLYLQKLTPNAEAFIFSSYLPGHHGGHDDGGDGICVGQDNSIHIVTESVDGSQPVVNSQRGFSGGTDGYYMHLAPNGVIIQAYYLGGSSEDELSSVAVDRGGNVHLYGWTASRDFPWNHPLVAASPHGMDDLLLVVVKAGTDSILLSTPWCGSYGNDGFSSDNDGGDLLQVRPTGYVTFAGRTEMGLPVFNALRDRPNLADSSSLGDNEGFMTRLFLPFAGQDFLKCAVVGNDSLRFETLRSLVTGQRFSITVHVTNPSPTDTAYGPDVIFRLPLGAILDPPGQSLSHRLHTPFLPGDTASITWSVRVDSVRAVDSSYAFRAAVEYDLEPAPLGCDRPFVRGAHYVPVERFASPAPSFTCTLKAPDSLARAIGGDSLAGNPFTVHGRIRNTGTTTFALAGMVLAQRGAGTAPWISIIPAEDSLQPGGTLAPGEELERDWLVRVSNLSYARECVLFLTVIDSFGVRMPGCEAIVSLPSIEGVTCSITGQDMTRFDEHLGTYAPSPLDINLLLANHLDTARAGITARVDLAHAPHLRLATGETAVKQPPPILTHGSVGARWLLEVIPHPATPVDDTLVVWYSAPGWPAERSCAHVVRIVPPLQAVSCALTMPTVTVTPAGRYAPDTMTVTWTLTNGGETTVPATRARLAIGGDTAWCLDPLEQTAPALAAKQSAMRAWRLAPPTSPFGRGVALVVTARDSVQNEIARCGTTLELPRVWPVVECTLTGPDTVHYLSATDSYQPDPSDLSFYVTNRVDTTITVTAALDLASAPHLARAPGETGTRALGQLAPRATANAVFRVTVDPRPETPVTDMPNTITTAHYGETADEVGCSTLMVIEGREKIYRADCFTAGHDTSWADVGNEDIIPHPLQMRLGIVNTGNEPLAGVTAAIMLPAGYILTTPPDSIQSYPAIAPGDTGRREWLMEVNREHPVEGAGTVRWTWSDARTSGECTRQALLLQGSPQGIALSRWRLDFRAERGKAIPAAESVNIWTGNNSPYQWASASADGWINVTTGILTGKGTVVIQPNTTALPEGFYEGTVAIVTNEFARPTPIEVGYEIYTLASTPAPPAPATPALTCSPNPVRQGGVLEVRYSSAATGAGPIRLRLFDALGREALAAATTPQTARMGLAIPAHLAAGLYFVEVTSREGRMVRGVAVMP